jgi:hypothetical protein
MIGTALTNIREKQRTTKKIKITTNTTQSPTCVKELNMNYLEPDIQLVFNYFSPRKTII